MVTPHERAGPSVRVPADDVEAFACRIGSDELDVSASSYRSAEASFARTYDGGPWEGGQHSVPHVLGRVTARGTCMLGVARMARAPCHSALDPAELGPSAWMCHSTVGASAGELTALRLRFRERGRLGFGQW